MPRLKLSEQETRQLIMDEAHRLFMEVGYDKTTVADIARACGFSPANVHRVFGTKGQINEAIAARMLEGKLAEARAAIAGCATSAQKVEVFARTIHQSTLESFLEEKRVHHMVAAAIEESWQAVLDYRLGLKAIAKDIVDEGVASGEFDVDDPDRAATAFNMCMTRLCHPLLIAEFRGQPDEGSVDALVEFVLAALGAGRVR